MAVFADTTAVLERQLLLQLGDRLRSLRKSRKLSAVELARRVGISRTTLSAVEAGDPGPSMGTYLRVMSALGIAGDLALLAGDTFEPAPAGTAAAHSRRARPVVQVTVTADAQQHRVQDLQSLALHKEAIRLVEADPALLKRAVRTLSGWQASEKGSRSKPLWDEWATILAGRKWRKVLSRTRHAQELRQASPLPTVLPERVRRDVLDQVRALRQGVRLGAGTAAEATR